MKSKGLTKAVFRAPRLIGIIFVTNRNYYKLKVKLGPVNFVRTFLDSFSGIGCLAITNSNNPAMFGVSIRSASHLFNMANVSSNYLRKLNGNAHISRRGYILGNASVLLASSQMQKNTAWYNWENICLCNKINLLSSCSLLNESLHQVDSNLPVLFHEELYIHAPKAARQTE